MCYLEIINTIFVFFSFLSFCFCLFVVVVVVVVVVVFFFLYKDASLSKELKNAIKLLVGQAEVFKLRIKQSKYFFHR